MCPLESDIICENKLSQSANVPDHNNICLNVKFEHLYKFSPRRHLGGHQYGTVAKCCTVVNPGCSKTGQCG